MEDSLSIRFIGTGGAFDTAYGNSAAIVVLKEMRILVDCGHTVFPRLIQLDLAYKIDALLITHLHDDHVGSLSTFILYHDIVLQKGRIRLFVPNAAMQDLLTGMLSYSLGKVDTRVDFRPIAELEGVGFIDTFGRHVQGMQTFAYYFTDGNRSIVYSGDNGDADYLYAQIAILDLPAVTVYHEVFFHFRMHAHAYYQDLMRLAANHETYGYHCDPTVAPADNTLPLVADHPEMNY